jgi:hypothetical protein
MATVLQIALFSLLVFAGIAALAGAFVLASHAIASEAV